ncbi:group 1 truncated hemoglobin [Microcoleus sp. Pol11C2]|uniref:group 1 truncated hemoglobin n=1 Tax=Microcoleus sp. Pol11C2 TaxID=3055389 RepID=UPI002FD31E2E
MDRQACNNSAAYLFLPQVGSILTNYGFGAGRHPPSEDSATFIFADPIIGKYFIGLGTNSQQRLRQLLVDQFCQAAGGPCVYTGRTMKLSHSGMDGGLTDSEFNAFANDISQALDKNRVNPPDKAEVLGFVNSLRSKIVEK